jgi:nitroimidazol reductase NimA-like FMN-containing flavoprotein (pyridoxamine 5'-phosphate oxidase superfamily)
LPILNSAQLKFLKKHELCRLGTASKDGMPHVTPVIYALDREHPVIAIEYGEKKLKNLKENPRACFLVDDYHPNRGLMIQGKCTIYERGEEYLRLLKILLDTFEYYRKNPWGEGESPILRITPEKAVGWGLKS